MWRIFVQHNFFRIKTKLARIISGTESGFFPRFEIEESKCLDFAALFESFKTSGIGGLWCSFVQWRNYCTWSRLPFRSWMAIPFFDLLWQTWDAEWKINDGNKSLKKLTVFENPKKKSHSTLRAKRATFTFWVEKSWLKMPKMANLTSFLKN